MNEKGNSIFLGLVILLLFSGIGLVLIKKRLNRMELIKDKQELLLCTKQINGLTQDLIRFTQKTNHALMLSSITKLASITFPQFGMFTQMGTKTAIKTLKKLQLAKTFAYVKKLTDLRLNSCSFSLEAFKTPIHYKLWQIERDHFGRAKFRGNEWKIVTSKKFFQVKSIIRLEGKTTSILIKKANLWLRQLSFPQS